MSDTDYEIWTDPAGRPAKLIPVGPPDFGEDDPMKRPVRLSQASAYYRLAAKARRNGQHTQGDHYQKVADRLVAEHRRQKEIRKGVLDISAQKAHNQDMTFHCDQCFDTKLIDRAGAEIACPYCSVATYHPSSVTVKCENSRWFAWDTSWDGSGVQYGASCRTEEEARKNQRRRQGVIRAAITRRNNKKGN